MKNYKKTYSKFSLQSLLISFNSKLNIILDILTSISITTPPHFFYNRILIPVSEISGKILFHQKRQRQQ